MRTVLEDSGLADHHSRENDGKVDDGSVYQATGSVASGGSCQFGAVIKKKQSRRSHCQ